MKVSQRAPKTNRPWWWWRSSKGDTWSRREWMDLAFFFFFLHECERFPWRPSTTSKEEGAVFLRLVWYLMHSRTG